VGHTIRPRTSNLIILLSAMGGSSSKEIAQQVESDPQQQAEIVRQLETQLASLQQEVQSVRAIIVEDVMDTTHSIEDAVIMRYSQLEDRRKIEQNIRDIFGTSPGMEYLVDTAKSLIATMTSTKEMTEIVRWQQRKTTKRIGDKVVGLECHYKVKILEKRVGMFNSSKETVCLLAYKFLVHTLDKCPEDYLDDEESKMLAF